MHISFLLALTLVSRIQVKTTPIVIPALRSDAQWVVQMELDGKPLRFALDDERQSAVRSDVAKSLGLDLSKSHVFTSNGRRLGEVNLSTDVPPSVAVKFDGVLSIDVLGNGSIGFDLAKSAVTFWPDGSLDVNAARDWVKAGNVRLGAYYSTDETYCEIESVNSKPLSDLVDLPVDIPISRGDFDLLGAQLGRLCSHPFVIAVRDNGKRKVIAVDPNEGLR